MDETLKIMIPTALIVIVLLMLYTNRRGNAFEAKHTGVYKTKIMMRGLESLFLLVFAAAALLALKDIIAPVPGIILIAASFICWLPFQALMYTMLSLGEEGITYMNPLRRMVEIPWKDVKSVSVFHSGVLIKSGGKSIRVRSFFTGFDKIKDSIKEKCPEALK